MLERLGNSYQDQQHESHDDDQERNENGIGDSAEQAGQEERREHIDAE